MKHVYVLVYFHEEKSLDETMRNKQQANVPLSGQIEHVAIAVVEGHDDSRGGIQVVGLEGGGEVGSVPDVDLAIRHLGESSGGKAVSVAHPDNTGPLDSSMSISNLLAFHNNVNKLVRAEVWVLHSNTK